MAVATAVTSRMKMVATVPISEPEPRWSEGLGLQVPGSETGTVQLGPRHHGVYIIWREREIEREKKRERENVQFGPSNLDSLPPRADVRTRPIATLRRFFFNSVKNMHYLSDIFSFKPCFSLFFMHI